VIRLASAPTTRNGRSRRKRVAPELLLAEPAAAAHAASLRYVSDESPGISRKPKGAGFVYVDAGGKTISDDAILERIRSLVIPPAWRDVWICQHPSGHIQATGRDDRGRKQYIYHPRWRQVRDEAKFSRMAAFGAALPKIRRHVSRDLKLPGIPREKVMATLVRLLETTLIRIGNDEYARANGSFGLTTLRNHHAEVHGSRIRFRFRGKSGKLHEIDIDDPRLARLVKRCQDLPGQELFQYLDERGQPHGVDSADVNDYLREITGEDFTAKDFRTWAATLLAAEALEHEDRPASSAAARRTIAGIIKSVAARLGNTATICRKCYIHPAVIDDFLNRVGEKVRLNGALANGNGAVAPGRSRRGAEAALLTFLRRAARKGGTHAL
jgi:DNA topoisomerase I